MRQVLMLLSLLFATTVSGCAVDSPASEGGYGSTAGALAGGCKTVCPKCKPGQVCPMNPCYLDCPKACVQTQACIQGATWSTTKCACVTHGKPAACSADADCRIEANYCGGCYCLALGPKDSAPTCVSTVKCFADPCLNHTAACVAGSCTLR